MDVISFSTGRIESFSETGESETNCSEDRKVISIQQKEIIDAGRSLDLFGYAFVNYQTFRVRDWEELNPCAQVCAIGNHGSSYVSRQVSR